jgi:predicted Zn finger-like uncharacterized protein
MIITCKNCAKKFNVDSSVIPEIGRLLQCNSCDHKWFFKKEIVIKSTEPVIIKKPTVNTAELIEEPKPIKIASPKTMNFLDIKINDDPVLEKILINKNEDKNEDIDLNANIHKDKKNYNILGVITVFIISFIALIIVLDTFKGPISKIVPDIEFLLYNLYQTINDIELFLRDLV